MDLKSGYPFWAIKNGLMYAFPKLEGNVSCDVLVIGGGITAALIARTLAAASLDVVIVEQRDVAWGSTAASTAMLQYEIDSDLADLAKRIGEPAAARVYAACAEAITQLQAIAREVGDVDFAMKSSLYAASSWLHVGRLEKEFAIRRKHGLDVEWLSRSDLRERFDIAYPGAILSALGAQVDPYRMASRLLQKLRKAGVRIFDRTRIASITPSSRNVLCATDTRLEVRAKHVVVAAGYATQKWLSQSVAANRSSYAYVTDPLGDEALGIWRDTLFWETARPYLYARTSADSRLVIGGEDDAIDIAARRDLRVARKVARLQKRARRLWPALNLDPAYAWAGTFAETPDGLPFFGAHAQYGARVLFAMAFGGNGITYSAIGADLILAAIQRRKHALAQSFGFERI